ncbi:MAG: DUF2490 domain-containing protein [Cycloclasticus sp.]
MTHKTPLLSHCQQIKLALVITLSLLCTSSFADGGMQFSVLSASKQLDSGHTLIGAVGTIQEEFQGKIASIMVAKKTDSGATWRAGYFGYFAKQGEDSGIQEDHRLRAAFVFRKKMGGMVLTHRSRVEYRMGELASGFRYRPAANAAYPIKLFNTQLIPYAEIEPFYDFKQDHLTLGLFSTGVLWMPNKNIIVNIGYMDIYLNKANTHTKGPVVGLHFKL